jgi:hypothetical protein
MIKLGQMEYQMQCIELHHARPSNILQHQRLHRQWQALPVLSAEDHLQDHQVEQTTYMKDYQRIHQNLKTEVIAVYQRVGRLIVINLERSSTTTPGKYCTFYHNDQSISSFIDISLI